MEKMTNKKALSMVLEILREKQIFEEKSEKYGSEYAEAIGKVEKILVQVEKKNSGDKNGKLTKTQEENEKIKKLILGALDFKPKQLKEINQNENLKQYSSQKLSALIRQMVQENLCFRIEEKKVAKFCLCNEPEIIVIEETEPVKENTEE